MLKAILNLANRMTMPPEQRDLHNPRDYDRGVSPAALVAQIHRDPGLPREARARLLDAVDLLVTSEDQASISVKSAGSIREQRTAQSVKLGWVEPSSPFMVQATNLNLLTRFLVMCANGQRTTNHGFALGNG